MAQSSEVRVGLIGVGAVPQTAHLPILSKMRGAKLVALCDNDAAKTHAIAERFGVPDVFTDIDDMLELEQLDVVIVATPNHLHEPHVLSALKAKVHVLCGRPLALSVRGVERILAAAAKVDRIVQADNHNRFRADTQTLDRFLHGGELGRLVGIRAGAFQLKRMLGEWRYRRAEAGGGAFMELGYPLLDLALWFADFPAPVRVSAQMERGRGATTVEDSMLVQLECAAGVSFSFDVNWSYIGEEDRFWFEILATRGSGRLAPLRVIKELNGRPMDVSPSGATARESAFFQSYRAQLAHFIAVVRGDAKYEPPEDQIVVHKVLDAIYKSAEEGKEVRL
ncbi:MAG: Gfo/Idh/MocA family oxidoreductase [Gemmatimonadaceae bacterium]